MWQVSLLQLQASRWPALIASTFSHSHYGEVLPFRLPNTEIIGSISSKYFARPDASAADEHYLRPDVEIDLEDKDAAWGYIVRKFGA